MEHNAIRETHIVGMGELYTTDGNIIVKTVLGSCIGLVLHDRRRRLLGIAHIVLPTPLREDSAVGKYADRAVPALIEELIRLGSRPGELRAYVAGGADMFKLSEDRKLATVGDRNIEATRRQLQENRIPLEFEEVGGVHGRRLLFDNESGRVSVTTIRPIPFS